MSIHINKLLCYVKNQIRKQTFLIITVVTFDDMVILRKKLYDMFTVQLVSYKLFEIIEGDWSLRSVSNTVKLLPCRSQLIELTSTFAPQYRDVCNQVLLLPCLTQFKCIRMLSFPQQLHVLNDNWTVESGLIYFSTSVSNMHWLGAWSSNILCHWRVKHLRQKRDSVGTSPVSPVMPSGDVRFEVVPSNCTASSSSSEMGGYFSESL